MYKIVIASDSFKGSLTSSEVADAVQEGIISALPGSKVVRVPIADGGEGTLEAMRHAFDGAIQSCTVKGPLGDPVVAEYILSGEAAIMEIASASGITLIGKERLDPMHTSTYGTGQMIADALGKGARKFLIGIGGSATNDGGEGMLSALGFRFLDKDGNVLSGKGEDLEKTASIDSSGAIAALSDATFTVACDVDTVFWGENGAARIFSPQKGAGPRMVECLDRGMKNFCTLVKDTYGLDLNTIKGSGAAGGLGGAFKAFLNADLKKGIDAVLDAAGFDTLIEGADLVVTGEGCLDYQTSTGKAPAGVLARASSKGIPTLAIAGRVISCPEIERMGFSGIFCITPEGMPSEIAMQKDVAFRNIQSTIRKIIPPFLKQGHA